MRKTLIRSIAVLAIAAAPLAASPALADQHGAHGKTIVDAAAGSPQHKTLVAAVKAAGLGETLSGTGPFTVFAPVDSAFAKLPAGTVDTLLKPENKGTLTKVLTYHVVPGKVTAAALSDQIKAGNGTASLTTVEGSALKASMRGDKVVITDEKGGEATVVMADVMGSNGVIHATDTVSMPG